MVEKRLIGTSKSNTMSIEHAKLGPPGYSGVLIVQALFKNRPPTNWDSDVGEREFEIKGILSKHPLSGSNIDGQLAPEMGGSYFLGPDEASYVEVGTKKSTITVKFNDNREYSLVSMNIMARHWQIAYDTYIEQTSVFLDHMSYVYNVPVNLSTVVVRDVKHEVQFINYVSPTLSAQTGSSDVVTISDDMTPIYALYREAVNSSSSYYQLLCYYKIMEGVFRTLRPALRREADRVRFKLSKCEEVVPGGEYFPTSLKLWTGKSITEFHNKYLTKKFRDAVAHFTLTDTGVLHVNQAQSGREFTDVVRASKLCSRIVIENHEASIRELASHVGGEGAWDSAAKDALRKRISGRL